MDDEKCIWLIRGKLTTCDKKCSGEYCTYHSKSKIKTMPCLICGKGTTAKAQTCTRCKSGATNTGAGPSNVSESSTITFNETESAMTGFFKTYEATVNYKDPMLLFRKSEPYILEILNKQKNIKFNIGIKVHFYKDEEKGEYYLSTKSQAHFAGEPITLNFEKLLEHIANYTHKGSGWILDRIEKIYISTAEYKPLKGGSYVDLPPKLKVKNACVNVKIKGDDCLRVSLKSALFPVGKNANRLSKYPKDEDDGLNFEGIDFPTPISQIHKVEKQNNLAINVYGWEKGYATIIRLSKTSGKQIINLMLYNGHYCWIKNLNRLLNEKDDDSLHYCSSCLVGFQTKEKLNSHIPNCLGTDEQPVRIEMPKEKYLKFKNYRNQLKVPYVIYADFEALNKKIEHCPPDPSKSSTTKTMLHEPCGFCYTVVRCDGYAFEPVLYRGPDAAKIFLDYLQVEERIIREKLKENMKMETTPEVIKAFSEATHCHICQKTLVTDEEDPKYESLRMVRDHCHITGAYRGAAHNKCNLSFRFGSHIPVVFHNLKGYDSHLIMQAIGRVEGNITCIPNNMEKYISFSLGKLRFIDSVQFLLSSLESLVAAQDKEDLKITKQYGGEHWELLSQKGVYPYEYMDDWKKFKEQLPPIEAFYSTLNGSNITPKDYERAKHVWNTLGCKNMGKYHDAYLKSDVLLLADVFEKFRKTMLHHYQLDPAHYYTSPGLSWDALLKSTGQTLELFQDYDMHLFIEKGMRGGISMVSKRYAKANNKYLDDYDPKLPSSYIHYLDANNLYGWAMAQPLPTGNFEWVDDAPLDHPDDDPKGYILEVDLEYPQDIHELHDAYPLAPERLITEYDWLSPYQKNLTDKLQPIPKLVPNLLDKQKYVVHYRNLKLYTQLGMKVTKIHRALKFDQSPWMKKYIMQNTAYRTQAKSDFEKNLYKLLNNSVFGKTMENLRKRVNVKLVRDRVKAKKYTKKPSYSSSKIFDENLVAISVKKSKLVLDKPVYVGMSILDLSKLLMYDFYYNNLKKQYGDRCNLLYTDTDSLLLEIKTEDIYADMAKNLDDYDTSDYPKDHPLHSSANKKVIGKMKDECNGRPVREYVGLRPKMYSILTSTANIKKAKGVKKNVVKSMAHELYKSVLFDGQTLRHKMNMLRTDHHQVYNIEVNKTSLSPLDTKRYILDNGIDTHSFGLKK